MWKEAAEAQETAITLDKNRTAARINAEVDLLVEDVKLKIQTQGLNDLRLLEGHTGAYLDSRVQAFSSAVASRHQQVLANKASKFVTVKQHQGKLMEGLMKDIVNHGYAVARNAVAGEAMAVSAKFRNNPKIATAMNSVTSAGNKWAQMYHNIDGSSRQAFAAWTSAYNSLNGPWNNETDTFEKANWAAKAARGLGPDTRWVNELVRVSGDVAQASMTEARKEAANADMGLNMADKAEKMVKGNSGNIVTLKEMLREAEHQANQAGLAR